MTVLNGIDASNYQGKINWEEARHHLDFAFIKASESDNFVDPWFQENWYSCHFYGIPRIAYHFFYDDVSWSGQVEHFHSAVRDRGHFKLGDGFMLDVEEVSVVSGPDQCIQGIKEFFVKAMRDIDKQGVLYTDPNTWINLLGNPDIPVLHDRPLFLADLGPYIPRLNTWPNGLSFLQYSFTGRIPGIDGEVDLDRFYGTRTQLRKLLHHAQ